MLMHAMDRHLDPLLICGHAFIKTNACDQDRVGVTVTESTLARLRVQVISTPLHAVRVRATIEGVPRVTAAIEGLLDVCSRGYGYA